MKIEKLIKIMEETPLAIRPMLNFFTSKYQYDVKGVVLRIPYAFEGISSFGIGLSYECDNMGKTLVHEAMHICNQDHSEDSIRKLTSEYWRIPEVRKSAQNVIVNKLGEEGL